MRGPSTSLLLLVSAFALSACELNMDPAALASAQYGGRPPPVNIVYFSSDITQPDADANDTLRQWADWLQIYAGDRIILEGHTDHIGTSEYNLVLGQRMAEAVRNRLIELDIAPERIDTTSFGEDLPAIQVDQPNAADRNRRVVISIIGKPLP